MSPKTAFDVYESGDFETLYDVAHYQDQWRFQEILGRGIDRDWPANREIPVGPRAKNIAELIQRIKSNQDIRVYRISDIGAILPGAYVTESLSYAQNHGRTNIRRSFNMYSMTVKPSELMVRGDPHEFIYLPNRQDGYKRYVRG